jgi:hypothetical protein
MIAGHYRGAEQARIDQEYTWQMRQADWIAEDVAEPRSRMLELLDILLECAKQAMPSCPMHDQEMQEIYKAAEKVELRMHQLQAEHEFLLRKRNTPLHEHVFTQARQYFSAAIAPIKNYIGS